MATTRGTALGNNVSFFDENGLPYVQIPLQWPLTLG
jgi:hypothetical protein